MATVHSSAPIWVLPGAGSSRPSATYAPRSVSRSSTMPLPASASANFNVASISRPPTMQRSNSIPYGRRGSEAATMSSTSLANPSATPLPQTSTAPRRPKTPAPITLSGNAVPKRPAVLRKRGATIHVARPVTPALQTKNLNVDTSASVPPPPFGVAEDPIKAARRTELLRAVASQVEEIEKVTDAIAAARRSSVEKARQRFHDNVVLDPPSPVVEAVLDPIPMLRTRRPHARRGSIDSTLPDNWRNAHVPTASGASTTTTPPQVFETPKRAKDWEKWAEDKVRNRRRLEEVWKQEDEEIERLLRETERRDKAQREKDARKEWERVAFLEQERQRTLRENTDKANAERQERQRIMKMEHDRLLKEEQERKRNQELRNAALAEELRHKELEQERRRIEEETRRIQEELYARQNQSSQPRTPPVDRGRQQQQTQQERPRAYFSRSRQRTSTREGSGERVEIVSDSDSDVFDAEWERFAEFFKLGTSAANSKPSTPKFKYQSPSTIFKEAWESYETRWSQLGSAQHAGGNLTSSSPPRFGFTDIPWPILHQPTRAVDLCSQLTEGNISAFILSPFHSTAAPHSGSTSPSNETRMRKMRIREALLRWHPDKIARVLNMVCDEERAMVKEGAETVARHLNALLSRDC